MGGERHVVIEKPDGSLVVGCNVDVTEPPPPPEEVVLAIPLEVVRYSPINAIVADFLLLMGFGIMIVYQRYLDIFNIIFGVLTVYALHRKPVPYQLTGTSLLGAQSYAYIMCIFFAITHMWWEAAYQFSCGSNVLLALVSAEEITTEHFEEVP
jgi:hypothetical protein